MDGSFSAVCSSACELESVQNVVPAGKEHSLRSKPVRFCVSVFLLDPWLKCDREATSPVCSDLCVFVSELKGAAPSVVRVGSSAQLLEAVNTGGHLGVGL